MTRQSIVICGGGIGGLALGIRLRQYGLKPLIVERQAGVKPQPKGEYFQPRGVAILRDFGLLERFLARGATQIRTVSHNCKDPLRGRPQRFEVNYTDLDGIDFGLAVLHEDILSTLREEYARLGGELQESTSVTELHQTPNGYMLKLSDGQLLETDIFIGADGRYSPSRKMSKLKVAEYPCDRFMMAGLLEGLKIPAGEFYTEEVPGGVVYAFAYQDGTVRGYVCFEKPNLTRVNRDRAGYFLKSIRATSLPGRTRAKLQGQVMIMPTVDAMLEQSAHGNGIWLGDAAGTVDPLGGHGMTLALSDASRIADAIHEAGGRNSQIAGAFRRVAIISRYDYFHARFLGIWIAILFMGTDPWARWAKWVAMKRYKSDAPLRSYLIDLFSGVNKDPFGLYDLPYLLGVLPSPIRKRLRALGLNRLLLKPQNAVLTSPLGLYKERFSALRKQGLDFVRQI